jgi:hypothetical protein
MVASAHASIPLLDFNNPQVASQWNGLECAVVQIQDTPGIRFNVPSRNNEDEWPGTSIAFDNRKGYATNNWSRYGTFVFEVVITGSNAPNPTCLSVELRDKRDESGALTNFVITPGKITSLSINLSEMPINLSHVEEIVFVSTKPSNRFTVTLMDLYLMDKVVYQAPEPVYEYQPPIIVIERPIVYRRPIIVIERPIVYRRPIVYCRPIVIHPRPQIIINHWPRNDHYTSPDYRRDRNSDRDRDRSRYQPRPPVLKRGGLLDKIPATRKPIIAPNPRNVRGPIMRPSPPATRGPITRSNPRGPITGSPVNQQNRNRK